MPSDRRSSGTKAGPPQKLTPEKHVEDQHTIESVNAKEIGDSEQAFPSADLLLPTREETFVPSRRRKEGHHTRHFSLQSLQQVEVFGPSAEEPPPSPPSVTARSRCLPKADDHKQNCIFWRLKLMRENQTQTQSKQSA